MKNEIASAIVDSALEVHRTLGGPGLLESVYEEALVFELEQRGLRVERQKHVPLTSKGRTLASNLRLDLLVEGRVTVECRASSMHNPLFEVQARTNLSSRSGAHRAGNRQTPLEE